MSNESDNSHIEEVIRLNGLIEVLLIAFGTHLSGTTSDKQKKAMFDLLETYKDSRTKTASPAQMKGIEQATAGLSVFLDVDETEDAA